MRTLREPTGATLSCLTIAPNDFGTISVNRIGRSSGIDAKNYTEPISKEQILQLANCLSQHGTGLFGIILTRTGDDSSVQYVRREQWMMHNKLILVLNDEDLIQMLSAQAGGERPEALVQQKIEDFRLAI